MRRALLLSLALTVLPAAASPAVPPAADAAARAAQADAEADRLAEQRVQAAARLREAEQRTADIAGRVDALAQRRRAAEQALADRARDLAPLLPLIERLALQPAETMLALPAAPDDAVRGLLVLRGLTGELERQAADLRDEQKAVAAAQAQIDDEAPRLRAARDAQAAQAAALDRQIDARRADAAAWSAAAERAQAEAARAPTLKGAVAKLALAQPRASEAASSGGGMVAPVAGSVVQAWGQPTDAGPATGVSYRAAPAARVVSPCGGRAVFAAPFRSYGLLLIVDCGAETRVVLGGLERLDVRAGETLRRGEPVGAMADWDAARAGPRPSLYVELRRAGEAVNPAPLLAGPGASAGAGAGARAG
jgi:septal ring factor EnvC (AmiA/AmiB activator)